MSFLLSIFSILQTFQVIWFDTDVDVKLNDNIEAYVHIPYCELYDDGVLVDTEIGYRFNGVNRTFISTVQTSYVKVYGIDYEAYFEAYDLYSVKTVYFNVYDDVPPTFLYIPTYAFDVGEELPDFYAFITYSDNYDDDENIRCVIDDSYIQIDEIGIYPMYYYLYDSSNNLTKEVKYVEVSDHSAPIITLIKDIDISYGENHIDINTFFKVTDKESELVSVYLDDSMVNYNVLGTYQVIITATNQSSLTTSKPYEVELVDTSPPELILKSFMDISVFNKDALSTLDDYILSVRDNYDDMDRTDVEISHDIDIEHIGSYHVYFEVEDSSNNKTQKVLEVEVVDDISPEIKPNQELVFIVDSMEPIWKAYFDISDNYNDVLALDIGIDIDVDMKKIGMYYIEITVEDKSKNTGYYEGYVEIKDTISPTIEQVQDIIITDFSKKSYQIYFSFFDNYDEQESLEFSIDDKDINELVVGIYPITIKCTDQSGNISSLETEVYVIDSIKPTIELTTYHVILPLDALKLNYDSYIYRASDNYDNLTKDMVFISNNINYQEIGVYKVVYYLEDYALNKGEAEMIVVIDDLERPVVSMADLVVLVNDSIDYLSDIDIRDDSSYTIIYDDTYIDSSFPGNQYLTYIVQDERGNFTKYIRKITIVEAYQTIKILKYVPIGLILLGSGLSIYYVYKKNKY